MGTAISKMKYTLNSIEVSQRSEHSKDTDRQVRILANNAINQINTFQEKIMTQNQIDQYVHHLQE